MSHFLKGSGQTADSLIMTITYAHLVATGQGFGNFWRLLARWRGSIYKVVVPELLVYCVLFASLRLGYEFGIKPKPKDDKVKMGYESWVKYCNDYGSMIPISFVLGFYVSVVIGRWWNQYNAIPWPDSLCAMLANTFHGRDEESRIMRRTIARYINLAFVRTMTMISPQAKKRFPTLDHIVELGLLTEEEKAVIDGIAERTGLSTYWIPLIWAGNVIRKARDQGKITSDNVFIELILAVQRIRGKLGDLLDYDWVNVPLVYTQVVTLAVYLYFFAALFGRQYIEGKEEELDTYVPIFLILEFFFYTGWLKVAETLVNPFGEDDDDFEVNWLIDRDITVALIAVDEIHENVPTLMKDKWFDDIFPTELPYTQAAQKFCGGNRRGIVGSAQYTYVAEKSQTLMLPSQLDTASKYPGKSMIGDVKEMIQHPHMPQMPNMPHPHLRLSGSGGKDDDPNKGKDDKAVVIDVQPGQEKKGK